MANTQFKTNIKCGACVEKVRATLDATVGKEHWQVDLQSPERILSISESIAPEKIILALDAVGYQAAPI